MRNAPASIGTCSIPTVAFPSLNAPPAMTSTLVVASSGGTRVTPKKNFSLRKTLIASLAIYDLKAEASQSVNKLDFN